MIQRYAKLQPLLHHLEQHRITPIFVGGCVRDHLLGQESLDIDIELYGVRDSASLTDVLKPFGKVNEVGKSFGVYKLRYGGYTIDLSLPRTENKSGEGHRGFEVQTYSDLEFAAAAQRRDFTINAIGYNPQTLEFLDPYNGEKDLRSKRLACVDPSTFVEDPLRVLRAVQFAARFELVCDPDLLTLCHTMIAQGALQELPKERIFEEIKKLLLLSQKPSIGLELLRRMGGLPFFSPLDCLENTPQDSTSHPEGCVWAHTLMALDVMARLRIQDPKRDLPRMFAVLLHDCAKPITTVIDHGIIDAPHHPQIGVEIAQTFLSRITDEQGLIDTILPLIRYHRAPRKLYAAHATPADILRLSTLVRIDDLIAVSKADFYGREFDGTLSTQFQAGEWLYSQALELGVLSSPPKALLMGRDLIESGLKPSPSFSIILNSAYNAQLNQEFFTKQEALTWLKKYLVIAL